MALTQDDATQAINAVATTTNRDPAAFTILSGDTPHGLIMVGADINRNGQPGACYIYSLRTGRVYPVNSIEDPQDIFAVIANRDATS